MPSGWRKFFEARSIACTRHLLKQRRILPLLWPRSRWGDFQRVAWNFCAYRILRRPKSKTTMISSVGQDQAVTHGSSEKSRQDKKASTCKAFQTHLEDIETSSWVLCSARRRDTG